jgi:hypothetical protein
MGLVLFIVTLIINYMIIMNDYYPASHNYITKSCGPYCIFWSLLGLHYQSSFIIIHQYYLTNQYCNL